jgi:dCMP deaminase
MSNESADLWRKATCQTCQFPDGFRINVTVGTVVSTHFYCPRCHASPSRLGQGVDHRPTVDEHFMLIATVVAMRGTCPPRTPNSPRGVGCVLARDGVEVASGYNGAIRKEPHCSDAHVGHDLVKHYKSDGSYSEHCERVLHAEENAVTMAARFGRAVDGATCYTTVFPCWRCYRQLANAGVVRIVFAMDYKPDMRVWESAKRLGIQLERLLLKRTVVT